MTELPPPRYQHLLSLIDDTGVIEHARYRVPRREHGYTTDDVARAVVVLSRAEERVEERVMATLVSFLFHAVGEGGWSHNRLTYHRRWADRPADGDHHGRLMWALAALIRHSSHWRDGAADVLGRLRPVRGPHLRPFAFMALAADELWQSGEHSSLTERLVEAACRGLGGVSLPWPERRLTYDNGRLPQALMILGDITGDARLAERGLDMLDWLWAAETRGGHCSFTPVGGWEPGEPRPGFDQQPIEAAAMAGAAAVAWRLTRERRWAEAVLATGAWLLGDNDSGLPLLEASTGACADGLERRGVNRNCGAESTISGLLVLQACHEILRLAVR